MDRAQQAKDYFLSGYNCAQSVLLAFADVCGLPDEKALLLASSFGGGMGRLREVCGAVSAMLMVAGARWGYATPDGGAVKAAHYARVQKLAEQFRAQNGSIICRELLGLPAGPDDPRPEARTAAYYGKRPCAACILSAARILERELADE